MVAAIHAVTVRPPMPHTRLHPARSSWATMLGSSSPPGLGQGWPQRVAGPTLCCPTSRYCHWCRDGRAVLPSPRRRIHTLLRLYTAVYPVSGPAAAACALHISTSHGRTYCRLAHKGTTVAHAVLVADAHMPCQ